jgi:predicted transposase/invertase (TIGR01784 family)
MRFGVGEGINQLFSNFLGKTLACFKRKSYLCFIKRNINNIRIMKQVDFSNFTPQEQREYEASKMAYRDIKNSIDTAKREGKEEGLAEGMEKGLAEGMEKGLAEGMEKGMNKRSLEIARKMLANGMDAATVMEITGLSAEEILLLKREK